MNLCIDQGNSSTKIGLFEGDNLIHDFSYKEFGEDEIKAVFAKYDVETCIVSSVTSKSDNFTGVLRKLNVPFVELNYTTPVPIDNRYGTPQTLGKDRLAAIVGAAFLQPDTDLLVIDAGTAITYDFIDASFVYRGGNIAPGLDMRLRALHEFTQKLPLVVAVSDCPLLGTNTNEAIASGALLGIIFEINGYIEALKINYPKLLVFLTGGSLFYFDTKLKSAIFAERNLVLIGLNRILQYNVQK